MESLKQTTGGSANSHTIWENVSALSTHAR